MSEHNHAHEGEVSSLEPGLEQLQELPPELRGLPPHILEEIERFRKQEAMVRIGFDLEKTYYLAGPMTGYEDYNYPTFQATVDLLRDHGLTIESPHENAWPDNHETMEVEALWTYMMKVTGKQLKKCDGIILMQGWPESKGVRKELTTALTNNLPVFFISSTGMIVNMNRIEESDEATTVGE